MFRGKEVSYCISGSKRTQPWCPTEVDFDLTPTSGQWGNCDDQCPTKEPQIGRLPLPISAPESCNTVSGPNPRKPCVFPFFWKGKSHDGKCYI